MKNLKFLVIALALVIGISSCKKEEKEVVDNISIVGKYRFRSNIITEDAARLELVGTEIKNSAIVEFGTNILKWNYPEEPNTTVYSLTGNQMSFATPMEDFFYGEPTTVEYNLSGTVLTLKSNNKWNQIMILDKM